MGDKTGISWTDATWNPVRGCSRVSEGCRNCYAERVAARFSGPGQPYEGLARPGRKLDLVTKTYTLKDGARWTGVVRLIPEHLADPLRWKKPRRIFVNSMSDLFHEGLTDDAIDQVFAVMALSKRHTFQVLTKRARRMREYITTPGRYEAWSKQIKAIAPSSAIGGVDDGWWPRFAGHIWLGVSVENQDAADERIPELCKTPAAVRFLSCEPLLGSITLPTIHIFGNTPRPPAIDWVIAGCESGPGARACKVDWLRSLRDQCTDAGVAFFLKQAEDTNARTSIPGTRHIRPLPTTPAAKLRDAVGFGDGSKRKAGGVIELPYLDGVQHAAFPEVRP